MNMTEHLHELLGGDYSYKPPEEHTSGVTTWWEGLTKFKFSEHPTGTAELLVKHVVPQRMIEAAARRDTCKNVGSSMFVCSECDAWLIMYTLKSGGNRVVPNYCPVCGRRVVYERKDGD